LNNNYWVIWIFTEKNMVWVCYIIVTIVGILHTVFNIYVLRHKSLNIWNYILTISCKLYIKT
jgi:hypothetical protein